jgi:hypothetical protein
MNEYFSTGERVDALEKEALDWVGTPWFANCEVKGAGVACHRLPTAIFVAVGALPKSFPRVLGHPSRHSTVPVMENFIDSRPEFKKVDLADMKPGDLVGLKIGSKVINHLGVVLRKRMFIHCMATRSSLGTAVDGLISPWLERVTAAWRIYEEPTK